MSSDPDNQDGGGEDVEEQTDVPDTEEGEKKEREEENMEEDEQKDEVMEDFTGRV